ncbi:MAG TPA: bifunctional diaminohydroxyphosphoribosylaminopyrimidine deaminase/5-amino-6-(5-phosphoribosylamino)uracil reductase RibD [bacterium]|nr:bifunctional diaminohydroxyphosphoribosylaminopyrimidine deaminase/5-amino-6-(5-phosphoribosylamino)uracil reductase RibD [bacterium]
MKKSRPRFSGEDTKWMSLAISEALKARGRTSPNPIVGAVLVRGGKLLAKGHHRRAGLPHAEIEALKRVNDPRGATLYVTLEPCCHEGKRTPPCTDAIVPSGIRRVVVGAVDPNPKVSGKGIRLLQRSGIRVDAGLLREECEELNPFFNHWIVTGRPYVILKAAASLDGRVALANGRSRWISGEASRTRVHQLRGEVDGILAGIGTVQADDPSLTARTGSAVRQPVRIVLDPHFRISPRARVLDSLAGGACWIMVAPRRITAAKKARLERKNAEVIAAPLQANGQFDLKRLLNLLGKRGLTSLLIEGGPGVWTGFYRQKTFEELWVFLAPKFLGADAKPMIDPLGLRSLSSAASLRLSGAEVLGEDALLVYSR